MTLAGLGVTTRTGSGVVVVTVVIPFVYPARDAVAVIVPGVLAFTPMVTFPSGPVTPVPVVYSCQRDRCTVNEQTGS